MRSTKVSYSSRRNEALCHFAQAIWSDDMPVWEPFAADELPQGMSKQLSKVCKSLSVLTLELSRLLEQYEIFKLIMDYRETHSFPGIYLERGIGSIAMTMGRAVIVSLVGLYDEDTRAVNVGRLLNIVLDRRVEEEIGRFNDHQPPIFLIGPKYDPDVVRRKLEQMQRRLRGRAMQGCLRQLRPVRHSLIAHFDVDAGNDVPMPEMRAVDRLFAFTANTAYLCSLLTTSRVLAAQGTARGRSHERPGSLRR